MNCVTTQTLKAQTKLHHEDNEVNNDDIAMSYKECDSSLHSGESEVPNVVEEWLKCASRGNVESVAAFRHKLKRNCNRSNLSENS